MPWQKSRYTMNEVQVSYVSKLDLIPKRFRSGNIGFSGLRGSILKTPEVKDGCVSKMLGYLADALARSVTPKTRPELWWFHVTFCSRRCEYSWRYLTLTVQL